MAVVTRATIARDALMSSISARAIFLEHGVNPEWCGGNGDFHTLGDIEQWCGAENVDGLITQLNAAIASAADYATDEVGTPEGAAND
jgi:hypothetical protein